MTFGRRSNERKAAQRRPHVGRVVREKPRGLVKPKETPPRTMRPGWPTRPAGRETSAGAAGLRVRRADGLRLRRSALAEIDREDGHRPDGEELRLPVLEASLPEVRRGHIRPPRGLGFPVGCLLVVVGSQARERLAEPGGEEDRAHHDRERVRVDAQPPVACPRPAGSVLRSMSAYTLLLVRLEAEILLLLRLVRALLEEPDRRECKEPELK